MRAMLDLCVSVCEELRESLVLLIWGQSADTFSPDGDGLSVLNGQVQQLVSWTPH